MATLLHAVHWLAGFVVLAEALNKLERTAPCAPGLTPHQRLVDGLKALAWALLAAGAAGSVVAPLLRALGLPVEGPSGLVDTVVLTGFAVLVIRTRVKEG